MENKYDPSETFLRNHEYKQNQQFLRIFRYVFLFPIILIIVKLFGLFDQFSYISIGIFFSLVLINYVAVLFLTKLRPYSRVTKYLTFISLEVMCLFISVTQGLYVFIIYLVVPLFSLLYLNWIFSLQIFLISYIGMILSILYRAFILMPVRGYTVEPKEWAISNIIILSIGYIINAAVSFIISKRNREIIDADSHEIELNLKAQNTIISSYVAMLCAKSAPLEGHVKRCSEYTRVLLKYLQKRKEYAGLLTESFSYQIISCSLLHDIGMISVPDTILNRSTPLSDEEYEQLKMHPILGEKLLSDNMRAVDPEYFSVACDMVLYHHENWDGTGYPFNRKGEEIPFSARILAVANTIDSFTGKRPDRPAISFDAAMEKLDEMAGTNLDPFLVHVAIKNKEQLRKVYNELSSY